MLAGVPVVPPREKDMLSVRAKERLLKVMVTARQITQLVNAVADLGLTPSGMYKSRCSASAAEAPTSRCGKLTGASLPSG